MCFLGGFFLGVFGWFFLGGFYIANPASRPTYRKKSRASSATTVASIRALFAGRRLGGLSARDSLATLSDI